MVATTNASGAATVYPEGTGSISGEIESIRYVADATSPFAATVDFTFTLEETGRAVLAVTDVAATTTYRPRAAICDTSGTAKTEYDRIASCGEQLKLVIAQGGDSKTGTFYVTTVD